MHLNFFLSARSAKAVKARQQRDGAEQDTPSMPHLREDVKITQVTKQVVEWGCSVCKKQCIPVREESRCIWYGAKRPFCCTKDVVVLLLMLCR